MDNRKPTTGTEVKQPKFFYGYTIVVASFVILMIVWGAQYSFGVFFKPVLNEFGWTRAETSGAYSLNMILIGVFSIFTGRLSDRFGARLVVTVLGFTMGLGYCLMSQINSIWQMYLIYGVLLSLGISGMWVPLISTIARWFVKRRGLMSGIAASGVGIGTMALPQLANYLITNYEWRTSYIIIGLIAMATIVIAAQFLRRDPGDMGLSAYGTDAVKTENNQLKAREVSAPRAIGGSTFWLICVVFLSANFCIQLAMVHIVPHATDIGISAAVAATIVSVIGIVSSGGKVVLGGIVDRIGSKRVALMFLILQSLSFLWLLVAGEVWMLYIFAVVFGVSWAGFAVVQSPLIADYFGLRAHGAIFGLAIFVANIGGAAGSLLAGRIFDVTGSYFWAFISCAALGIAGQIASILLKPHNK
ncbi:MAG: MFS transporter [Dehalococcoidales bacterium]|nr:MFS transporter [Dehalococcoidales bacterium]